MFNIINVFIVIFYHFNAYMLNKSINLFKDPQQNHIDPELLVDK